MKYILTVIAAALTLSACSTTTAQPTHSAKAGVSDSCCKTEGDCSKKH